MMIVFRGLFIVALVSSSVVLSMQQNMSINYVLNAVIQKPYGVDGVRLVQSYLNNGGSVNAKGTIFIGSQKMTKMNLLMVSALVGYTKLMRFLLEEEYIQLNCKSEVGNTALMIAAVNGRTGLVSLLLDAGADPLARNQLYYNTTALWQAENSPIRYHPLHNSDNKYYNFPRMIAFLKEAERNAAPRKHEKIKNRYQLRK
jgi:hypothetical protein